MTAHSSNRPESSNSSNRADKADMADMADQAGHANEPAKPTPRGHGEDGTTYPSLPPSTSPSAGPSASPSGLSPLPGEAGIPDLEAPPAHSLSRKGLFAVGLLVTSLLVVSGTALHRLWQGGLMGGRAGSSAGPLPRDQPAAAGASPRRLEMPEPASSDPRLAADPIAKAPAATAQAPAKVPAQIPALIPTRDELAEPIPVRRTGPAGPGSSSGSGTTTAIAPQDAPVMLVSTRPLPVGSGSPGASASVRPGAAMNEPSAEAPMTDVAPDDPAEALRATSRHLEAYQRRLQDLMDRADQTTRSTDPNDAARTGPANPSGQVLMASPAGAPGRVTARPVSGVSPAAGPSGAPSQGIVSSQIQSSATPRVTATTLGQRSLVLPKGSSFTCALKTRVISAASGLVTCQVQRNVYGDDGRVLLIERGAHLDGEYRLAAVRAGMVRIPVLWTRLRTPLGVTVDLESPATGPLGESGIGGDVDHRWRERLGAALLLSLIDDSVKLVIQNQAAARDAGTLVLPSTTANTSKLAEKVLDSTINIPPLIHQHQGAVAAILVARDLDFSTVYALEPSSGDQPAAKQPPAAQPPTESSTQASSARPLSGADAR